MASVLIADDDRNNRLLVRAVAEHRGHEVFEAADGAAVLQICRSHRVDLLLLDLGLPGMSGSDVLRALRAAAGTQAVRVALYTATRPDAAMGDFMEMYGVRHRIEKPSDARDLMEAIEAALRD